MNQTPETQAAAGVCARDGCANPVEDTYIPASQTPELSAIFQRFANEGLYCSECTAAAEAKFRERELEDYVRKLADEGLVPRDIRQRRIGFSKLDYEKHNPEVWRRARAKWPLDVPQVSLALEGPPGVGKTFAAHCMLNGRLERGQRIASIATASVLTLKDSRAFQRVDWLHLDDFDKVEWSQALCLRLFHLVEGVRNNGGKFVVCLNDSLEAVYEAQKRAYRGKWQTVRATFDRLAPCQREALTGPNLRRLAS